MNYIYLLACFPKPNYGWYMIPLLPTIYVHWLNHVEPHAFALPHGTPRVPTKSLLRWKTARWCPSWALLSW